LARLVEQREFSRALRFSTSSSEPDQSGYT
jgi:hypothetical protein